MLSLCIFVVCEIFFYAGRVEAVQRSLTLIEDEGVKTANIGEAVKLCCTCRDDEVLFFIWFQQILGGKPEMIKAKMTGSPIAETQQKYGDRFDMYMKKEEGISCLVIENLQLSDSAMYYCTFVVFSAVEFGRGVFLHVKPSQSNIATVVDQPAVAPFGLGHAGSLNCTVQSEPCEGGQELYWLRQGKIGPSVVYLSEGQCRTAEPTGTTCTSSIAVNPMSDAAVYYCAVVTCGEVVFGSGTKVEITGSTDIDPVPVRSLSIVLAVSIAVLVVLSFIMYKLKKRSCCVSEGAVSSPEASDALNREENTLHFSVRRSERLQPEENNCVYSQVKSRKE